LTVVGGTYFKPQMAARNAITRLTTAAAPDLLFNQSHLADNAVLKMAKQTDGKLILAGLFSRFGSVSRNGVARLSADGVLDPSFNPGTGANGAVFDVVVQSDGKIVIVGAFTQFNGLQRNRIARLNADGSLDSAFNNPGTGPNGTVECVALQADGRLVIGGQFGLVNGNARAGVARLNNDGTVDTSFNNPSGSGTDGIVRCLAILPTSQKIVIGGDFRTYQDSLGTYNCNRIAVLNTTGMIDTTFALGDGANSTVRTLVVQSVQSSPGAGDFVWLGGSFTQVQNVVRRGVARLTPNGSLDLSFNPPQGANGDVFALAILPNESTFNVAIGGSFSQFNSVPVPKKPAEDNRNGITIVNLAGGSVTGFVPASGTASNNGRNSVRTILEQDGKLVVGGWVQVKPKTSRVMWLTDSKNDATVTFSQGKLAGAPLPSPLALFDISTRNTGVAKAGNTGGVTWSYSSSTGIVSGQFSPDQTGTKRIAKYTGLLIPVTPSDIRGMGSFDLPELPNGTTITTKNAPIFTGKVLISPEP
jgi:uncharacterized delta-60 repeat protein